jgi:hypothetical protein
MRMRQAPYNSDFTRFMTGAAGPSELPDQSRVPFSCSLEEHVRYSKRDEWDDACHIPLFPPTSWTRKEVRAPLVLGIGQRAELTRAIVLTGWNGTERRTFLCKGILQNIHS